MSGTAKQFQVVEDQPAPPNPAVNVAMRLLLMSVKTFSTRAVIAASHLFTGVAVASVWALFMWTLPNPSTPQLVGLALYGMFVLAIEWVRRRG